MGGQFGHKGYNLSKKDVEDLIDKKKIEVREFNHIIKGTSNKDNTVKYKLGIEIKPYVEKYIFKYDETSKEKLPKEFYTDVTYDNSIKALTIELGAYNVISYDRLSDFLNVITNRIIKITNSSLVNILYEFSNKSISTLNLLEEDILNSKINYTDETGTKFNGKNMYVRNYSNENTVIYKAHKNKGHNPIKEDNILSRFCGGIMGDHDTTLYSYGLKEFDKDKIKEYIDEIDSILKLSKKENKKISSNYYKTKSEQLYRRIKKYKKNHLYFIKNFEVPFDNNMSEQDLRIFKTKTKISGGFRSMKAASHYVNALSIIKTSIKRNINPYNSIKKIFENQILFS